MKINNTVINTKVAQWWNEHPFVYCFDKPDIAPSVDFFNEIDRKFIKWTPWGQTDNRPLSAVIDYSSLRGKRVLDIAVGTGWSTEQFVRAGAHTTAIDITPNAVALTNERLRIRNLPETDIMIADAQDLPFPDASFDFVLAWGCLMHMPDTQKAINEIFRILKPGGQVAAMMYNKHSLHWWYYIWLSKGILRLKLLRMSVQQLANRYTDGVYQDGNQLTKFFSSKEVHRMFNQFSDCTIVIRDTTTAIDHLPHRLLSIGRLFPQRFREWLTQRIGQSLWIEAKK